MLFKKGKEKNVNGTFLQILLNVKTFKSHDDLNFKLLSIIVATIKYQTVSYKCQVSISDIFAD